MKEVLNQLKEIPVKLVATCNSLISGFKQQVSTARGTIVLIVVIAVLADIFLKGSVGIISFSVEQVTAILGSLTGVMKEGGWQLITLALILILVFKKDKA